MHTICRHLIPLSVFLLGTSFGCGSEDEKSPAPGQRIEISERYGDDKERGVTIRVTLVEEKPTNEVVLEQITIETSPPSEAASGKLEAVLSDVAFKRTDGEWPLVITRASPEAAPFAERIQLAVALLEAPSEGRPAKRRLTSSDLFGQAPSVAITEIERDGEQIELQSMGLVSTGGTTVVSFSKVGGQAQDGALRLSGKTMRLNGQASESIWMTVSTSQVTGAPGG